MKSLLVASAVASAAAFGPDSSRGTSSKPLSRTTTTLNYFDEPFDDELGAQPPLGFFDPLGIVADGDEENFDRLRYIEIKHGRICMLAVVGYLVNKADIYWPGYIDSSGTKFSDLGSGWEASVQVPMGLAIQILVFIGFLELYVMKDSANGAPPGEFPGDFRNGFDFGWDSFDEETKMTKRAVEISNGRAANMGMLALMVHDAMGNADDLFPY